MTNNRVAGVNRGTDFDRLVDSFLDKIQEELMPDKAEMIVAINMETGEYVLGRDAGDASRAFRTKWPKSGFYMCRVDGRPAVRM